MEANSELTSILRHIGTVIAGALISKGWIDDSFSEAVIGLVMALGVMGLAWWNKQKAKHQKAATAAVALALPAQSDNADLNAELAKQQLPPVAPAPVTAPVIEEKPPESRPRRVEPL